MSVLVCAGKLTYPIKYSSDKLGISGVSYTERLTEYLKFNKHIEKVIFVETVDNRFLESDVDGFDGGILVITNKPEHYSPVTGEDGRLTSKIGNHEVSIRELENLRVSDIQWEIMTS